MLNRHFVSHSSNEGPIPLNTQEDDGTELGSEKNANSDNLTLSARAIGLQSMSHWFENGRGIAGWLLDFELSSLLTFFLYLSLVFFMTSVTPLWLWLCHQWALKSRVD